MQQKQQHNAETTHGCVCVTSDHITSFKLGLKKINETDKMMASKLPPLLMFIQVMTWCDANGVEQRDVFVVLSLTNDKTGWGAQEVEKLVFKSEQCKPIMKECTKLWHWSDHGGPFTAELMAGFLLTELPQMFRKLTTVEANTFASRHGKGLADCYGSICSRWLRQKQQTDEGLMPDMAQILAHLRREAADKYGAKPHFRMHFIEWKPTAPEDSYFTVETKNTRKSYSKRFMRRQNGDVVIVEQGLATDPDAHELVGDVIETELTLHHRNLQPKPKRKTTPKQPNKKLTEAADWRLKFANTRYNVTFVN